MLRKALGEEVIPLLDRILDPLASVLERGSLHGPVGQQETGGHHFPFLHAAGGSSPNTFQCLEME